MNAPQIIPTDYRPTSPDYQDAVLVEDPQPLFHMAGFDGIIQLRKDKVDRFLKRYAPNQYSPLTEAIDYLPSAVTPQIDHRISEWIAAMTASGHINSNTTIAVQATLSTPTLHTLKAEPPAGTVATSTNLAQVHWAVNLQLIIRKGGVDDPSEPNIEFHLGLRAEEATASEAEFAPRSSSLPKLQLASGTVVTLANIIGDSTQGKFIFWSELDFIPIPLQLTDPTDPDFHDLLKNSTYERVINSVLEALIAYPAIQCSPKFRFPLQPMPPRPVGTAPLDPVVVQIAVTHTLGQNEEVLALGVNAPAESPFGDATAIGPFLTSQAYACALSLGIVRSIIVERWVRYLPKYYFSEIPIQILSSTDPGETEFSGRGRVRFKLEEAIPRVTLVSSPFLQDALQLTCRQEIQLLNLWTENGDEVGDLGDLADPARTPLKWRIQLFTRRNTEITPGGQFMERVAHEVLRPLYNPMLGNTPLNMITGRTFSTRGLVVILANLNQ